MLSFSDFSTLTSISDFGILLLGTIRIHTTALHTLHTTSQRVHNFLLHTRPPKYADTRRCKHMNVEIYNGFFWGSHLPLSPSLLSSFIFLLLHTDTPQVGTGQIQQYQKHISSRWGGSSPPIFCCPYSPWNLLCSMGLMRFLWVGGLIRRRCHTYKREQQYSKPRLPAQPS